MTDPYFVLVAGSGETSRANVEALMDDHYYAHGANGTLVLPFENRPSQGQIYAAQFAKDKNKAVFIFCYEGAETNSITNTATVTRTADPVANAITLISGKNSSAFLLWNDEDESLLQTLGWLKQDKIVCFDLTDGLLALDTPLEAVGKPVLPVMPEIETTTSEDNPKAVEPEETDEEYEDEDEEELDDEEALEETEDVLYAAIYEISKIIAESVYEQLKEKIALKEDK
jgi:hypothetical protein